MDLVWSRMVLPSSIMVLRKSGRLSGCTFSSQGCREASNDEDQLFSLRQAPPNGINVLHRLSTSSLVSSTTVQKLLK